MPTLFREQEDCVIFQLDKSDVHGLRQKDSAIGALVATHVAESTDGVDQISLHDEEGFSALWIGRCCIGKLTAMTPHSLFDAMLLDVLRACPVRPVTWSYQVFAPRFNRRGKRAGIDELASASGLDSRESARKQAGIALARIQATGETRPIEVEVMTDRFFRLLQDYTA